MSSNFPPFDLYKDEFSDLVKKIEERLHAEQDASDLLSQCEFLLPQMALEARSAPDDSLKQELVDILNACKMQLHTYKTLNNKMELLPTKSNTEDRTQRERLQSSQDLASRQNAKLEGALRSIRETEEVAAEMNQELSKNRETLQNAQSNIGKMSSMTEEAKSLLGSMMRNWF
jgi:hypothetical protein